MSEFQDKLKILMHNYVKQIYKNTRRFPHDELYGVTSQLRRAALSIILNYIEGYARFKNKIKKQFFETSFGSLKETKYLVYFSFTENYISEVEYNILLKTSEEISKMLWSEIKAVDKEV